MSASKEPEIQILHWATVYRDLQWGSLETLARYLRQTNGVIDPQIATYLANLIDGPQTSTGYRVVISKHLDIGSKRPGREQRFMRYRTTSKICRYMADAGAFERGQYETALKRTAEKFHISESTVKRHWRRWKDVPSFKHRTEALKKLR